MMSDRKQITPLPDVGSNISPFYVGKRHRPFLYLDRQESASGALASSQSYCGLIKIWKFDIRVGVPAVILECKTRTQGDTTEASTSESSCSQTAAWI